MNPLSSARQERALTECAPISGDNAFDRAMRHAIQRAQNSKEDSERFANQQAFDRAIVDLVRKIPVPSEVEALFASEHLVPAVKRSWKKTAQHPAILSGLLAIIVIAGIALFNFLEHLNDFPGSATAHKLLIAASTTRTSQLDAVQTDAGALSDLFFMKYRLEHCDVPPEFAQFRTLGCRVFDDEDGHRVAQVMLIEKHMQLFFFPVDKDPKTGRTPEFSGWRYVSQENWIGAVQERDGICFMAAMRGREKDLASYLPKKSE
ncbi:MAG: hypothetical protein QOI04_1998 [Verrucomicrobiota bacterium]|jgi:hypothetical protein